MVVLNRIYTRTGDDGTTALGSGDRRKKYDLRVAAYGTLDEVNATIGMVRLHTAGDAALDRALGRIQNDLFDVEADLCLSEKGPGGARLTVTDAQVDWIEGEIDRLNADLTPLRSFILPGGTPAAAYMHLARTICRRAERIMVELRDRPGETVTDASLKYVNRLSDFLFVAGRYVNDKGALDILWGTRCRRVTDDVVGSDGIVRPECPRSAERLVCFGRFRVGIEDENRIVRFGAGPQLLHEPL